MSKERKRTRKSSNDAEKRSVTRLKKFLDDVGFMHSNLLEGNIVEIREIVRSYFKKRHQSFVEITPQDTVKSMKENVQKALTDGIPLIVHDVSKIGPEKSLTYMSSLTSDSKKGFKVILIKRYGKDFNKAVRDKIMLNFML